jgi:hypothetical protein
MPASALHEKTRSSAVTANRATKLPGLVVLDRAVTDHAQRRLGEVGEIGSVRDRNRTFHFGYNAKTWTER